MHLQATICEAILGTSLKRFLAISLKKYCKLNELNLDIAKQLGLVSLQISYKVRTRKIRNVTS